MRYRCLPLSLIPVLLTLAGEAGAVASAELYQNQTYTYGRFEARVRFAAGDGVISSFFLWKPGSEMTGTFWNELDFEKLGADCHLQTNPLYGLPVVDHHEIETIQADLCGGYHTYAFEWTPTYIAYLVDGVEVRRDGQDVATAFAQNAASGMQMHLNIWPGDASFGGNFDPASLPLHQFVSWVQYSSFADGAFTFGWREEFDGPTVPSGWAVGNWASAKNLSTHAPLNVSLASGLAVLSLTADGATGFSGTPPPDDAVQGAAGSGPGTGGDSGTGGEGSTPPAGVTDGGADSGRAGASGGSAGSSGTGSPAAGSSGTATPGTATAGTAGSGALTGAADTGAAGTNPPLSGTPRPASSSSGCSVSSTGRSGAAAWLVLGGVALIAGRRRRGCS